jgi:hypothetical protein
MQKMQNMGFHFSRHLCVFLGCLCIILVNSGCLNYRIVRQMQGIEIEDPTEEFVAGISTISEVLTRLGAPAEVLSIEQKDLLIYERFLLYENRLSLGIPLLDVVFGGSADISAYGSLTRYDTLAFFFTPDGLLDHVVFEKGSETPYIKTLLSK